MSAVQLFGKLPAHGDFVSRGLSADARDSLDLWLAGSMSDTRERLGDDVFAQRFDTAPPWRCVVPTDGGIVAGALAPSVDAVGRRYPIYLARADADAGAEAMAEACEALLYDALAGGWDADALVSAAASITADADEDRAGAARWWTLGNDVFDPAAMTGARPTTLFQVLLDRREEDA